MQRDERIANTYLIFLIPVAGFAIGWALYGFPTEKLGIGLGVLSVLTVFFSSYLRIQLPRTKIHLTISDALIFLAFLLYGGEVAVLLAALETAFTSLNFRRQGVSIKLKTSLINIMNAALGAFVSAMAVALIFGPVGVILENGSSTTFIWLLATMGLSQFVVNSVCVAGFVAVKTKNSLWNVWNEYCLNALVMYFSGAVMAGLSVKAIYQVNVFLFAAVIGFFALVYLTYRRYAEDVKATGAKAENAERRRAEQAEAHVKQLQHYVEQLETSSKLLSQSREKFRHVAYHDELTDLPNRKQFLEKLNALLEDCRLEPQSKFAVLFVDLNRFKTLNESLGHSVGDMLIKAVGERLKNIVHRSDLVGRFSGDEFAILSPSMRSQVEVTRYAEEIATRLSEPFTLQGRQVFTSVTIGIAFGTAQYDHAEEILRDTDIALYHAKENQKSLVIFDSEMHTRAVTLLELETDLRLAVERKEFEIYYQPIVNLDNVELGGFEALIRWNHPQRGMVSPAEFIPLAESTGLIIPMTVDIIRAAARQLVEWQLQWPGNDFLTMSVNLSAKHFTYPDLIDQIEQTLLETGIAPNCLKLELTESAVMENAEHAIATLKRIKATGVRLSIDDFGTGYSSLSYLHRFPTDTLKVDRSFVSTMEQGSENGEIVRTVLALAKALKLSVIAEGIESIHQFHQLRVMGCEYGQGYLFSRPLPVSEVARLFADKHRWRNILPPNEFGVVAQNGEFSHLRLPS